MPIFARFQKEIKPAIMEKYVKTGKVKYVYRDLITMGENSVLAAEAANCAPANKKIIGNTRTICTARSAKASWSDFITNFTDPVNYIITIKNTLIL